MYRVSSVSPSQFLHGAGPCPFSQRHATFLNQHKMPYILVKNHENLTKTKEVTVFFILKPEVVPAVTIN